MPHASSRCHLAAILRYNGSWACLKAANQESNSRLEHKDGSQQMRSKHASAHARGSKARSDKDYFFANWMAGRPPPMAPGFWRDASCAASCAGTAALLSSRNFLRS